MSATSDSTAPARVDPDAWLARPGIRRLLGALDAAEGSCRFVGGAVRDTLLGRAIEDLDLATLHVPDAVVSRLSAARVKTVPTGIEHGTITAVSSGTVVEVTTLRSDVSTDGRRATVAFTDDWAADASRRDFTINALYADPFTGQIFDYFDGLADIAARRVRFIGDPLARIAEDHLRILRFFRFHARFGAGAPDAAGLAACAARANDLMALSRERIADELTKLLAVPDPSPTIAIMLDAGIFAPVLPEIVADAPARIAALARAETEAGARHAPLRRLAAMLPPDPELATAIAARLKLSNKAKKRLGLAVAALDPAENPRALAYAVGTEAAVDRLLLAGRPVEAADIAAWPIPRLPISGGGLIARGVPEGPEVARTLRAIDRAWVAAGFPTGPEFDTLVDAALQS
ncbi:CCA tRNA nucleotidyltransferase [Sphingomonas sp. ASV193]|uniref:CCA tRNA nucleotidyltransferase n=1 Tax=Sphingomonas sp. ASV193 TaxID=3144405 RepID=UPI0032E8F462